MDAKSRTAFGLLIAAQAAHSIEEYLFRLFDVFAPTRAIIGLFSRDLETGFVVANVGFVLLGVWSYLTRVRPGRPSARAWAWFWTILEGVNGFGHVAMAAVRGGYFPGAATAPVLAGASLYLGYRLMRTQTQRGSRPV